MHTLSFVKEAVPLSGLHFLLRHFRQPIPKRIDRRVKLMKNHRSRHGIFQQKTALPFDADAFTFFASGNCFRIASLMCASHMPHIIPSISAVYFVMISPRYRSAVPAIEVEVSGQIASEKGRICHASLPLPHHERTLLFSVLPESQPP